MPSRKRGDRVAMHDSQWARMVPRDCGLAIFRDRTCSRVDALAHQTSFLWELTRGTLPGFAAVYSFTSSHLQKLGKRDRPPHSRLVKSVLETAHESLEAQLAGAVTWRHALDL